jgi:two-component system sensor histidine kinase RstB
MTRLFLRFYLGVIAILFAAWLIQAYVFRRAALENNIVVIEHALGGGARLAREQLVAAGPENWEATLEQLQLQFDYPLRIVSREEYPLSTTMSERMDRGEIALYRRGIIAAMPHSQMLLELGPLPAFAGPTQMDIMIGLGSVFLLSAMGIAVLLRPLARGLRSVERTALAIAGGDLSARIGSGRRNLKLPLAGAFNAMADRLEHLLRSQKELLQAVSHELRTPLARIKFGTELLRSATDPIQRTKRIEAIDDATDQLDELVGELLTYVRLDAQTESAEYENCSIGEVLEEAIDIHAALYPQIEFTFAVPDEDIALDTPRSGLLRAVGNLTSNAGKYSTTRVILSATEVAEQVTITVDDDGPGIAADQQAAVFEPFKRLNTDSMHPGTGLGLALVRRIARRLGGDVTVSTSPLGGARFTMRLPKHHAPPREQI